MMEETLVIIKPDATERGLVGEIVSRFEEAGFEIVQMRCEPASDELFREIYAEHRDKPHFEKLIAAVTAGLVCFLRLRRDDAVRQARALVGPTDPREAPPGTIRADLALDFRRNSVHASDSEEAARRELKLVFGDEA
ncbi:MAG: nucleoside-diphosphate kinase [Armatimonadetes bacterium]|nr:nucleoside-diphosphate kinase [Armatimonadota bacterium]